jgi:hypothetical protein
MKYLRKISAMTGLLLIASCTTPPVVVELPPETVDLMRADTVENPALNVSVIVFDKGLASDRQGIEKVFAPLRTAEADYLPFALRETLVESGHFGAVRVVPEVDPTAEVLVTAEILLSNGVELKLRVQASDSTGRIWLDKEYYDRSSDHGYEFDETSLVEPFQVLFNKISNDMVEVRRGLSEYELARILDTSMLRYAVALSPPAFGSYLVFGDDGRIQMAGLPARDDAMYVRVKKIRDSEYVFIDAVDEQFENLFKKMRLTYAYWRRYSHELIEYSEKIEQSGSGGRRSRGGSLAAMEDVYKSYQESKMNEDSLREMAASFDNEISPTVTELEGKVIQLSGSLESQYEEWRHLLQALYAAERGPAPASP